MRAAWHIAINSLKAKSGRSILLILAVAIAASLAVAVSGGVRMARQMATQRVRAMVGQTGYRIVHAKAEAVDPEVLAYLESNPKIDIASPQRRQLFTLAKVNDEGMIEEGAIENEVNSMQVTLAGIDPRKDRDLASDDMLTVDGRPLLSGTHLPPVVLDHESTHPIVVGSQVQRKFKLKVGDLLEVRRRQGTIHQSFRFKVCGIIYRSGSMMFQRPLAYIHMKSHNALIAWFAGADNRVQLKQKPLSSVTGLMPSVTAMQKRFVDPYAYSWIDLKPASDVDHDELDELVRQCAQAKQIPALQLRSLASKHAEVDQWEKDLQIFIHCVSGVVFMSAGFIVFTSLLTSVAQQRKELAMLRCIGCSRSLIGGIQLIQGFLLGLIGGVVGFPVGIAILYGMHLYRANAMTEKVYAGLTESTGNMPNDIDSEMAQASASLQQYFEMSLPFEVDMTSAVIAALLASVSTMLAAAIPAVFAVATRPLKALVSRPRFKLMHLVIYLGLGLLLGQMAMWMARGHVPGFMHQLLSLWSGGHIKTQTDAAFWMYVYLGIPMTFVAYFLLVVPLAYLVSWLLGSVLARICRMPVALFTQSVRDMPYRLGFTAGALMVGLAILLGIWTDGTSIMRGWFDKIKMPDAVLAGLPYVGISETNLHALKKMPEIEAVCASSAYTVQARSINQDPTRRFGISGMLGTNTLFVASDIDAFMKMTEVSWIEGDPVRAQQRLADGGAILVSREYKIAHKIKLGDFLYLETKFGKVPFEIAGVIASPGLDIAVHYFDIGTSFEDTSIASVFGTREDGRYFWGAQKANMALLRFDPAMNAIDQEQHLKTIASEMSVMAQSSLQIKATVVDWVNRSMHFMSLLAVLSLLIACLGASNLVVANLNSRRFELGVLKAIGTKTGMITRLIIAESILVAITGCFCGTLLGYQLSLASAELRNELFGLGYEPSIPWDIAIYGYLAIFLAALLTALPAVLAMLRKGPRELMS